MSGGLVLGAGSGIAGAVLRQAWRLLPDPGERWVLTVGPGRPRPDLAAAAAGRLLDWREVDAGDNPRVLLDGLGADGWRPDRVLVAWGRMAGPGHRDEEALRTLNGMVVLRWLEALASWLEPGAHVAVLGSVAGDRPRPSLGGYALGKQDLERGVDSLRRTFPHHHWTLVKPGPVATAMTATLPRRPALLTTPEAVAPRILAAWEAGAAEVYAPGFWRLVSRTLGLLPGPLYRRLPI